MNESEYDLLLKKASDPQSAQKVGDDVLRYIVLNSDATNIEQRLNTVAAIASEKVIGLEVKEWGSVFFAARSALIGLAGITPEILEECKGKINSLALQADRVDPHNQHPYWKIPRNVAVIVREELETNQTQKEFGATFYRDHMNAHVQVQGEWDEVAKKVDSVRGIVLSQMFLARAGNN